MELNYEDTVEATFFLIATNNFCRARASVYSKVKQGTKIELEFACLLSLIIVAIQPSSMAIFARVKCYRKSVWSVGIRACKRGVHGLKREMEPVADIDLLVPRKLEAFVLGVLSISVKTRRKCLRQNCGRSGRFIATTDGLMVSEKTVCAHGALSVSKIRHGGHRLYGQCRLFAGSPVYGGTTGLFDVLEE